MLIMMGYQVGMAQQSSYNIEGNWNFLADSVGGCLTGGQYCHDGNCGNEGCCFNRNDGWRTFFKQNKKELTKYLIEQLPDTNGSRVHACPFSHTTRGELAVYALQKLHKVNWYDLDPAFARKERDLKIGEPYYSIQSQLLEHLSDKKQLELMIFKWRDVIR